MLQGSEAEVHLVHKGPGMLSTRETKKTPTKERERERGTAHRSAISRAPDSLTGKGRILNNTEAKGTPESRNTSLPTSHLCSRDQVAKPDRKKEVKTERRIFKDIEMAGTNKQEHQNTQMCFVLIHTTERLYG